MGSAVHQAEASDKTFDDVIGIDEAKADLQVRLPFLLDLGCTCTVESGIYTNTNYITNTLLYLRSKEIVLYLKDPKRFTRLGGKLPKGYVITSIFICTIIHTYTHTYKHSSITIFAMF